MFCAWHFAGDSFLMEASMKKAGESVVERAMGTAFYSFHLLVVPFAGLMVWWMHGDINLTLDSEGFPIITQVFTFFAYLIPGMMGLVLVSLVIFGISLLYHRWIS